MIEDDFYIVKEDMPDLYEGAIVINGDLGYEIDGSKARSQSKKLVKEIIKNQEMVKHMKERIEYLKKYPTTNGRIIETLEELLGGEK